MIIRTFFGTSTYVLSEKRRDFFQKNDVRRIHLQTSLYIKNITSFLIEGDIFTLNKSLTFKEKKDLYKLEKLIDDLLVEV